VTKVARKLALRTVAIATANGAEPQQFAYGEMMCLILKLAPPGRGLNLVEVLQAAYISNLMALRHRSRLYLASVLVMQHFH
jgi:hypothetical protein